MSRTKTVLHSNAGYGKEEVWMLCFTWKSWFLGRSHVLKEVEVLLLELDHRWGWRCVCGLTRRSADMLLRDSNICGWVIYVGEVFMINTWRRFHGAAELKGCANYCRKNSANYCRKIVLTLSSIVQLRRAINMCACLKISIVTSLF